MRRFYLAAKTDLVFSLGCQAVIPCSLHKSDLNSIKWFYKKGDHNAPRLLYYKDEKGIEQHQSFFRSRMKVPHDGSLIINHFREVDEGLYWCEICSRKMCLENPPTVLSVKKETLKETHKTVYVITGISLTETCPGDFVDLKWTFESLANSNRGPEPDFVTHNKSMHIGNVKKAHAGRYICWKSGCEKLLTVHLCVLTGPNSEASSVSCAVTCDMELSNVKANSTINVETGTGTISVHVDPDGSLNCTAKQMFDGHRALNSTKRPSDAFNNSTDLSTEYLLPVTCGTSAGLASLILMSIFICYRTTLLAAFPVHFCCRGVNARGEEESSVVYSSTVFRRLATRDPFSDSGCVYSEIRVKQARN
ncbi:uncharacterized protein LOC119198134 [Pungitius pungitius]|uniref:uncharacterized protein LOC119198134 n=1 Tax=Pungitius pungitius TaxID=134920 RepID=UPI002E11B6C7